MGADGVLVGRRDFPDADGNPRHSPARWPEIERAGQKEKRPGVASILVALLVVSFLATSIAGILTAPLSMVAAHVSGFSIISGPDFVAAMLALCAEGGYGLVSVMVVA